APLGAVGGPLRRGPREGEPSRDGRELSARYPRDSGILVVSGASGGEAREQSPRCERAYATSAGPKLAILHVGQP
ncbi:MAG: hypothetical protein K2X32_06030, partial [Phycisphaerales bacterium]|nr:hypothetical protein [Phycisphaerales bacterium]